MRLALFDTETTGLPKPRTAPVSEQPHVCELGVLVFDTELMAVTEEYSQLIKPPIPMPEDVIKIHGITDEKLVDAPTFRQAWFGDAELKLEPAWPLFGATIDFIIAHNAPFDCSLLGFEFERMGVPFKLPQAICTVQEFIHEFGRRPKLIDLYLKYTGQVYEHKHRAIDDTRVLLESLQGAKFFDQFVPAYDGGPAIAMPGRERDEEATAAAIKAQAEKQGFPCSLAQIQSLEVFK